MRRGQGSGLPCPSFMDKTSEMYLDFPEVYGILYLSVNILTFSLRNI